MIALDRFARTGAATALALALSLSCAGGAFAASEATKHSKSPPVLPPQELRIVDETTGAPVEAKPTSEVENYCLNIADKAQDARYAIQEKQLRELEGEITSRIDELETRRAEYQKWMEERKAFLESASTVVVDIYSKMKSDAAAPQLAKLGNENAAMILVRLKPRQASDILSEMEPAVAAEVAKLIVEKTSSDSKSDEAEGDKVAENQQ